MFNNKKYNKLLNHKNRNQRKNNYMYTSEDKLRNCAQDDLDIDM